MPESIPTRHQMGTFTNPDGAPMVPRVGGSGFTAFHWQGHALAFAQTISHQAPQPVAAPVAIHPLDHRYPVDIITPAAIGPGTIQVALYELYNEKIWDRVMRLVDLQPGRNQQPYYNDLAEVFVRLANIQPYNGTTSMGIQCSRIVYPPTTAGQGVRRYADVYMNCKITDIRDDETVEIGTMDMAKVLTIQYTRGLRQFDASGTADLYSTTFT